MYLRRDRHQAETALILLEWDEKAELAHTICLQSSTEPIHAAVIYNVNSMKRPLAINHVQIRYVCWISGGAKDILPTISS